jgi:MFS family permease
MIFRIWSTGETAIAIPHVAAEMARTVTTLQRYLGSEKVAPCATKGVLMDDRRITPLAGVLSVVLFVIALLVIESDVPDDDAPAAEIAAYFSDSLGRLAIGGMIWGIAVIALIWFLDGLRSRIGLASAQLGRLAYGFGFAAALFLLANVMPELAGAFASDTLDRDLDAGAAEVYHTIGDAFFFAAEVMLAGFFSAVGLAALKTRVLPAWLGGVSLVLALVAIIPPIGWAVVVFAFPLWLLLVSVLLWRGAEPAPTKAI